MELDHPRSPSDQFSHLGSKVHFVQSGSYREMIEPSCPLINRVIQPRPVNSQSWRLRLHSWTASVGTLERDRAALSLWKHSIHPCPSLAHIEGCLKHLRTPRQKKVGSSHQLTARLCQCEELIWAAMIGLDLYFLTEL